jgi:uncharacterized protein (DUF1919 family)
MLQTNKRIKGYTAKLYHILLRLYFRWLVGNKEFCIISNDCWGGEMYKLLKRQYNTPFIGLMLMSPCYISLLEDLKLNLSQPLIFKKNSRYPSMQKINAGTDFPVAVLGDSDIEIQFLHYKTEGSAKEKWERRVKRIDWNNLLVKYDCGKDYADKKSVEAFLNFSFSNKLIFGQEDFGKEKVFVLKNYSLDAVVQFRNCFLSFNPVGSIWGKAKIKNGFEKLICKYAFRYL